MESKKLPVLWMDASDPILKVTDEHVTSGVVLTSRPYLTNREPYIPVARVRELEALMHKTMEAAYAQKHHSADTINYWLREIEEMIADVEDDGN